MKKALIHDWFYTNAGGEKVVKSLTNIWDDFEFYALIDVLNEKDRKDILKGAKSNTSFIQKLPTAKKNHRKFLQLFPLAIEGFNLAEYDIVISSSSSVAKGVLTDQNQLHICYCHSPMRYAWNLYFDYLKSKSLLKGIKGWYAKYVLHKIRQWDVASSNRVDYFIANSNYIARRIKKIYNREAAVIYPPVDTDVFELCTDKEDYYVAASRLVSYKKIEVIIKAFNSLPDKKLIVIGDGPDRKNLQKIAKENIKFEGNVSENKMVKLLQKAKALVFAADEDFGIIPVEAQSCGTPVIGYKKGGLLETIIEDKTGVFFHEQTPSSITQALRKLEKTEFSSVLIRENALRFSRQRFEREIKVFIEEKVKCFFNDTGFNEA